jgi:exonuclease SbcD
MSVNMTKLRFIHTADLHLDSPFRGLSSWNTDLAARLKDAAFKSFSRIIDICIEQQADFLIIAGDIFESDNKSLTAQLKFVAELKRLSDKGISSYFVCGNHDPVKSWLDIIQLPENAYRFDSSEVEHHTYKKDNKPVADIYGISFGGKAVKENLALRYRLKDNSGRFSVAVLHGTVGAAGPHENYAPFRISDVKSRGFDYWALGHIHKRMVINERDPVILYPGNPQGRDFGETGSKGCTLVEVDRNNRITTRFIPVQLIRFEEIEISLGEEDRTDSLADKIQKARLNIEDNDDNVSCMLRINITGRTPLHSYLNKPGETEQLIGMFNEGQLEHGVFTWIDQLKVNTSPLIDINSVAKGNDFTAEIIKIFKKYETDSRGLADIFKLANDEISYSILKEVNELSIQEQREILEKAKWMLLDQILR